jgi:MFS family permease
VTRPAKPLTVDEQRHAQRLSFGDGIAYAVMIGAGESFFIANAIRLGATPLEIGLVIALPLLVGSLGPVVVVRLLQRAVRRRPLVVACALLQALSVGAVAVLNAVGGISPWGLIALLCGFQIGGQASGAAWSSWFGDLVPGSVRGHWFAMRTRAVQAAAFVSLVGAGLALHWIEPVEAAVAEAATPSFGFALVFGIATLARLISVVFLALSPEPPFRGLSSRSRLGKFLGTDAGRNVAWLVGGGVVYQAVVYLSGPYFTPFMLESLRLDYAQFTIALGAVVAAKVLTLPAWGRQVDRRGALPAFRWAMVMTALVPAPWLFLDGPIGVWLAQAMSGVAWAGHEIAIFALILESTRSGIRPQLFAVQSVGNAIGQVGGSLGGAAIVGPWGFVGTFAASLGGRLVVALALPWLLREPRLVGPRPQVVLRMVGYRPGVGVVHRPVVVGEPKAEEESGGAVQ